MNEITVGHNDVAQFLGAVAGRYAYTPSLRAEITRLTVSAHSHANRYFVLEGAIVRAAQPTRKVAEEFMADDRVLVIVRGCGKRTHVTGTNGGTMPCGANLTALGKTEPYYCAVCELVAA